MSGEVDNFESMLVAGEGPSRAKAVFLSVLQSVYGCFYQSFKSYYLRSRFDRTGTEVVLWTLYKLVYTCQLISLTYPPDLSDWASFKWWVYVISITRLDFVFVKLGVSSVFYIISLCVAALPLLVFLCLLFAEEKQAAPSAVRLRIAFVLSVRIAFLTFLPSLCMILAAQKYAFSSSTTAPEYLDVDSSTLQFPIIGLFSFPFALLLVLWTCMHVVLNYDPFYTRMNNSLSSRAHSKIEAAGYLCHTFLAISHLMLQESNRVLHLSLCAATGFAFTVCHFMYLPYYNRYANFATVMNSFVLGWVGTAQMVGGFLNSTASFFILTVIIPPPACLLCWDFIGRREHWVLKRYIERFPEISSPYLGDLAIRLLILQSMDPKKAVASDKNDQILDLLQKLTGKFKTSKYAALSEFLYVYSVQDHEGLARLHLSKARRCVFDFEANYNLYRFDQLLQENAKQYYEEVDYVRFRGLYDNAKKADEDACLLELEFWRELSSEAPVVKSVESMGIRLYDAINLARKLSTLMLKQYPQNNLALKLYGTFLLEVYNDTEKGQELLSRGISQDGHQSSQNRFSYFDDSNGILLVAGRGENIGCISYLNAQASQLLGIPQRLAHSMNIANFLPDCVIDTKKHNTAMARFLSVCRNYEANLPVNLFILNNQGVLLEVLLQVKCMALDTDPFFIVVLKAASFNREIALYDENELIQEHTPGFPVAVGHSDMFVSLKGCGLRQVFPDFESYIREKNKVHLYRIPKTVNELFLRLVDIQVGSHSIRQVQVTSDFEESKEWGADTIAAGFNEQVAATHVEAIEHHLTVEGKKKGIMKSKNSEKNSRHITMNLNPVVFEIGMTDFMPGKHVTGKAKDATPLKKEEKVPEKEEEEVDENAPPPEILDLKDLADFMPSSAEGSSGKSLDQASKFSEFISMQGPENDKKMSAASVASSAVSSNASFTSSHTAQLLLKNVNTAMSRFKIAFVLTHIVVIAAVISMMLYLLFITEQYLRLLDVTDLSDQRTILVDIAQSVRTLQLHSQGLLRETDEVTLRSNLTISVQHLDGIIDSLTGRVPEWRGGRNKDLYLNNEVIVWERLLDQANYTMVNLVNFLKSVVAHATTILQTPPEKLTSSHPSFFYIYQNSFGTGAKLMNESLHWFIDEEHESLSKAMDIILILSGTTLSLLGVFFFGVICPTVISVERANQSVWSFFYRLPLDIVQEMCFRSEGRLETTHGLESEQREDDLGKFKNLDDRDKIKCTRKWPAILTRMWIYYVLTIGFFVFFYYQGYLACFVMLENKPRIENWAGERTLATVSAYFWLQESLRVNTSQEYFDLTQKQYHSAVSEEIHYFLDAVSRNNERLTIGAYSRLGRTPHHEGILFSDGCTGQVLKCYDSELAKGLHAALHGYILDIYSGFLASTDLATVALNKEMLQIVSRSLQSDYDTQIRAELTQKLQLVIGITVLYVVLSAGFYFLLYLPMANGVRRAITHTWELARLIPIDLLERILKSIRNRSSAKGKK